MDAAGTSRDTAPPVTGTRLAAVPDGMGAEVKLVIDSGDFDDNTFVASSFINSLAATLLVGACVLAGFAKSTTTALLPL
jgi:hypothetical protein